MEIRFQFNLEKAIQAMAFLVRRLGGGVDKVHLTKFLYLADRDHFLQAGHPIAGDSQYALPWGPLPTCCLDVINGQWWPQPDAAFRYLHVSDNRIAVRQDPGSDQLDADEQRTLERIVQQHGRKNQWALIEETHNLPEYKSVYVEGTSRRIPYELMLSIYGGEQQFRHGRPVVSAAMRQHMVYPFLPGEDADL